MIFKNQKNHKTFLLAKQVRKQKISQSELRESERQWNNYSIQATLPCCYDTEVRQDVYTGNWEKC